DRVWAFLTDPHRVAECLPGSAITGEDGAAFNGTMKVKLGPVSSTYEGSARFDRMDADAYAADLSAEGRDSRGKGAADMTMKSQLSSSEDGTDVHVLSEVHVTGVLAQLGRGMVEDVSDQLFEQFTACMKATLEAEAKAEVTGAAEEATVAPEARRETPARQEALDLGAAGGQTARRAGARLLRRPFTWVVFVALAFLAWKLFG
ncbi:MAG: SRPBCC family protein, partial [Gemmatimonadota bacterium]